MEWISLLSAVRMGEKPDSQSVTAGIRSAFEQDYDRIVFSTPFRMLQDKTQVFPLSSPDFVHTRLTHSLEVSSVGRSLGKICGRSIVQRHPEIGGGSTAEDFGTIVAAAALAHDIGNPPFGHAGESAISGYFRESADGRRIVASLSPVEGTDLLNYEGNAQGFRLLSKDNYQGLRLTWALLGAFTKYPRGSSDLRLEGRKSHRKYGFFHSNRNVFEQLAEACGLPCAGGEHSRTWCRHPLAFLTEAADDICYSIIDLEDGTNLGLIPFPETLELLGGIIGEQLDTDRLRQIRQVREQVGLLRAMTIHRLINQCAGAFLDYEKEILECSFDSALSEVIPAAATLAAISEVSRERIYRSQAVIEREVAGFEVLQHLMEAFGEPVFRQATDPGNLSWRQKSLLRLLPGEIRAELGLTAGNSYGSMLVLLDFISGLTDSRALRLYRNIRGIALPGIT
jgi:dGTPase